MMWGIELRFIFFPGTNKLPFDACCIFGVKLAGQHVFLYGDNSIMFCVIDTEEVVAGDRVFPRLFFSVLGMILMRARHD